jgi:hypothetical protein
VKARGGPEFSELSALSEPRSEDQEMVSVDEDELDGGEVGPRAGEVATLSSIASSAA